MSRAVTFALRADSATRPAHLASAPLPTTLLLTIGSLMLPPWDLCTG